ncbi:hypothetical protein IFM89_028502 [Coptis chinensis]|uniref:5'-3' DNA helicase ZGRF1-like N-terminal domain-containing protein n=1 Tax=Coptis chinensis TaxID=261450 RepID=A0A835HSN1_9MAGN|nr:hypothetical protein IFM89_028502 [Coptis chinensis]
MEELKKWTVTYTKHLKQKRKLYQDGVLQLHCSNGTHKFFLYDENGMVIDSRFLKKGEAVECGKTLNFSGYLVDILDIEDKSKSLLSDLKNVQEMVKKPRQKFGTLHGTELKPSPLKHFEEKVKEEEKEKTTEWHALYTMQKTQKAKKYHDGILRLVVGLSHTKQVFLYDDSDKLLESRFLKKDEVVRCGETLTFEGYLVDIGNLEENCQPIPDSNVQGRAKRSIENFGRLNGKNAGNSSSSVENGSGLGNNLAPGNRPSVTHNIQGASKSSGLGKNVEPDKQPNANNKREWVALYTAQKTQKAKKFHDGVLRLSVGVCQRKQVTLLSDDGTILSSKYLKSSEDVKSGSTMELTAHLVEIGEERTYQEVPFAGEIQSDSTSSRGVASDSSISHIDRIKLNGSSSSVESEHNGLGNNAAPENRPSLTNNVRTGMTSCKYLSFSEDVRTGTKLELTGHLVEIGEAILLEGGDIQNANSLGTSLASCPTISTVHRMKLNSSDRRNKTKSYGPPNNTSSGKDLGLYPKSFNVDKDKFSQSGTRTDPIRDAHQILFTLKRPMKEGFTWPRSFELNLMRRSVIHIPDGNPENYNVGSNAQVITEVSQSECFEKLPASGPHNGGVDLPLPSLVGSDSCPEDPERKNCKELKSKGKEQVDKDEFPSFDLGF